MADAIAQALDLPFQEAIDFFKQKARVPTEHWTDVWRTAHSHSFMVAGATTDALVEDFQTAITKALESGTTLAEFRKDFDTIVQKHGWSYNGTPGWRSRIIYETNLSTAYSAGRYAQMTEPGTLRAFPYWTYRHGGSLHPRLQHLAWDGITLAADDPWFDTHFAPNGWRCSCRIGVTSRRDLRRMGKSGPDRAPPLQTRPWRNPKTGAIHQVPVGIDPGFDYNPGKAWKEGPQALPVKAPALKPVAGAPPPVIPLAEVTPDVVRAFIGEPRGTGDGSALEMGVVPHAVQQALGASSPNVLLSAETMEKQREHHADLVEADYLALGGLLAAPDAVIVQPDGRVALAARGRRALVAVLKATVAKDEVYLVSLFRARMRSLRQRAARGTLLSGEVKDLSEE